MKISAAAGWARATKWIVSRGYRRELFRRRDNRLTRFGLLVAGAIHRLAAGNDIALLARVVEEALHFLVLHLVLQRPEPGALLGAVIDHRVLGDAT
jgi:hypothetical protein